MEHIRTTGIALAASVVTVLERGIVRKRRVKAVELNADGLSDLAFVVLGLLRLEPQDADELAKQLGLRGEQIDEILAELESSGFVERSTIEVESD
jgi:DNA-binding MarR family transcriptional regulator